MKSTIFEKQKQLEELKIDVKSDDDPRVVDTQGNLVKKDSLTVKLKGTEVEDEQNLTNSLSGYHNLTSLKEKSGDNVSKPKTINDFQKSQFSIQEKEQDSRAESTPRGSPLPGPKNLNQKQTTASRKLLFDLTKSEVTLKTGSSREPANLKQTNSTPSHRVLGNGNRFTVDTMVGPSPSSGTHKRQPTSLIQDLDFLSRKNLERLGERLQNKKGDQGSQTYRIRRRSGAATTARERSEVDVERKTHIKNLFKLRKQLIKNYSKELSGPKLMKIVDATGRVIERLSNAELSKRTVKHTEESEREDLSADETIVYEEQLETGVLIRKKVKREIIDEHYSRELLADIDRQIMEASTRFNAELKDIHQFQENNILENFALADLERDSSKMNLRSKSSLSDLKSLIFARANNNLPSAFKNIKEISDKVQIFILVWLRDNVNLEAKTLEVLLRDSHSRANFFKENKDLFEIVLDTILKRPFLYSKIKEFVFDDKLGDQKHLFAQETAGEPDDKKVKRSDTASTATHKTTRVKDVPWKGEFVQQHADTPFLKTTVIAPTVPLKVKNGKGLLAKSKKAYYDQLRATSTKFTSL